MPHSIQSKNDMNVVEFNSLSDERKMEIIVDADKIGQYEDRQLGRFELFRIDRFYAEVKVNFLQRYRKIVNTYDLKDIPLVYSGAVYGSLPS